MSVEVEMLKGPAKGSKRVISERRAKALASVGFVRVVPPEAPKKAERAAPKKVEEAAEVAQASVEQAEPEKAEEAPEPRISPRTGRPVQQYRRRDVRAED